MTNPKNQKKVFIKNTTKGKLPRLSFSKFKDTILGKEYELSVAFVSPKVICELNKTYCKKNEPTDILSFPLSKKDGEIIFCMQEVKRQAKDFNRTSTNFLQFLLIHGLLHLKGFKHSSKMESEEEKFGKILKV
ncbi:MAG: rRNA maturation RNase YbeY [Candidatus Paceibacterota bacterium]|jgi:probable rRNA maturation factor